MPFVAIIGSGALGGAVAHALAAGDRVPEVRLIDSEGSIARGKALDITQSAAIARFATRVTAADAIEAAAGASVVVLADAAASNAEHAGEPGLALLRRLIAIGDSTPVVCAGIGQRELIARAVIELQVSPSRIIGSAPTALESALRALVAVAMDGSGAEISLRLVGVPPRSAVVAWEESAVAGQPLSRELPAHVIAGLNARIPVLWPPGPYALGAACARTVDAIAAGSRRRFTCFVAMDAGPLRAAVTAMPVELNREGVRRILQPALTRQERTLLENAIEE
jgi:malate dehydrogenase